MTKIQSRALISGLIVVGAIVTFYLIHANASGSKTVAVSKAAPLPIQPPSVAANSGKSATVNARPSALGTASGSQTSAGAATIPDYQLQSGALAQGAIRQSDVQANFKANGKSYEFEPNQLGNFPTVTITAKAVIPVSVHYKLGTPGEPVVVQVQDGGGLAGGSVAQKVVLNDQGQIAFNFSAGDQTGIYRVTLVKANDYKTLNFWVGAGGPSQD